MKPRIYINKVVQNAVNHFTVEAVVINPIDKIEFTMTIDKNKE